MAKYNSSTVTLIVGFLYAWIQETKLMTNKTKHKYMVLQNQTKLQRGGKIIHHKMLQYVCRKSRIRVKIEGALL